MVRLHREFLTYCREHMKKEEYALWLGGLAIGLNGDKQHQDALAVANECLRITPSDLSCNAEKAHALFRLGRLLETKTIIEKGLTLPAISEVDAAAKRFLRTLLGQVNEGIKNSPSSKGAGSRYGTGFYVSEAGHIVTNLHVADGCVGLRTGDGTVLKLIGADKKIDAALLQELGEQRSSTAVFRETDAVLGESVVVFGFPLPGILSSSGNVTTGTISGISGLRDNARNLQITAPIQPGNSGGPLLDQFGIVVGVVMAKLDAAKIAGVTGDIPQNVNFAIKGREIITFLTRRKIAPIVRTASMRLTTEAVAASASSFTTQIVCQR